FLHPGAQPAFYLLTRPPQHFFNNFFVAPRKSAQHKTTDLPAILGATSNSNLQSRIRARPEMLLDGLKPMMTAAASVRSQPNRAQGQIRIIRQNQNLLRRQLI